MMPNAVIAGAILMGYWAIGTCFARFWRTSHDRFFAFFAFAFWLFAAERLLLILVDLENEMRPYVYIVRLIGYLLILFAIFDKNRSNSGSKQGE